MNPTGIENSYAYGVGGNQQVGEGDGQALLWSGTASSAVDLNPTNLLGFYNSSAFGTNGTQQVGEGSGTATDGDNALLWSDTAVSAIDPNPTNLPGFGSSDAYGISPSGTQQVGQGVTDGNPHAMLWSGTAGSAVDLNPNGFSASIAYGTNGTQQVGYGYEGTDFSHALLWLGTAASADDLQLLLPANQQWTDSIAYTVDANGDVFGTANGTVNGLTGQFAMEWMPALVGDTNFDGTVNLTDLLTLLNNYGESGKDWQDGDFNYDGTVNLTDLLALLNNYGQSASLADSSLSGSQVAPEPATFGFLSLGFAALLTRRRNDQPRAIRC